MELSNDRITLEYKTYNMLKAQLETSFKDVQQP